MNKTIERFFNHKTWLLSLAILAITAGVWYILHRNLNEEQNQVAGWIFAGLFILIILGGLFYGASGRIWRK